jgi:heme-degrading monooxygenase HmoA
VAYVIAWQFVTRVAQGEKFEAAYGPDGGWVQFFRRDRRYMGTELVRDVANARRYVTLDFWQSEQAYDEFREQHAEEYTLIDLGYESLTESEQLIGRFVTVDSPPAGR